MATLRIPRGSSPVVAFTVYEAGEDGATMDLAGLSVSVAESNLPFEVEAEIVDPATGSCQLIFPDTMPMVAQKGYQMRLRVGDAGEPGTFTTPQFEVIAV